MSSVFGERMQEAEKKHGNTPPPPLLLLLLLLLPLYNSTYSVNDILLQLRLPLTLPQQLPPPLPQLLYIYNTSHYYHRHQ